MPQIAVVTRAPRSPGNMILALDVYLETGIDLVPLHEVFTAAQSLDLLKSLRRPAFHLGEILVLDQGREIVYPGRTPALWDIEVEHVETIEEAITVAQAVTASTPYETCDDETQDYRAG